MARGSFEGYVDDELVARVCVWFPVGEVDLDEARTVLGTLDINQKDFAWALHPNTKWCAQFGWPCDQEGEPHTHFEAMNGEPTHTAVWRVEDESPLAVASGG